MSEAQIDIVIAEARKQGVAITDEQARDARIVVYRNLSQTKHFVLRPMGMYRARRDPPLRMKLPLYLDWQRRTRNLSKIKLCQISSKVRSRSLATDRRRCFMDCFKELLML